MSVYPRNAAERSPDGAPAPARETRQLHSVVSDVPARAAGPTVLQACREGDADAWESLIGHYERLVFSVAVRNGASRDEAADITQATFMALLESIDRLREDERLASWLMTVARRLTWRCKMHGDRERDLIHQMSHSHDPITDWERTAVLHESLRDLGQPCRDLLQALYFDPAEPSYADIAERLGRSIGGIGPMRARCLQRLRSLLGEDIAG